MGAVSSILTDDAPKAAVAETTHRENEEGESEELPLTTNIMDQALKAVSQAIFPHRALENQKLWMRHRLKKPSNMPYRLLESKILRMNVALPFFPDGDKNSKFTNKDLLEILECSQPQAWRAKFNFDWVCSLQV